MSIKPGRRAIGRTTWAVVFKPRLKLLSAAVLGLSGALPAGAAAPLQRTVGAADVPPAWPTRAKPPAGAPNILVIMTDDVSFGASSTFGGPVKTETFDELANEGLRYNGFHTTAMCSPTRASLLTGRNPHKVGMGTITNLPSAYPGYTTVMPKSAGTVAEMLRLNGYNTAMFGKAHLTPEWELSPAGPFDRWPTGLGFEYFYGFLESDTSQWEPSLVENTTRLHAPRPEGYHLDQELADRAIRWIDEHRAAAPDKPFFLYYATGTPHAPLQAPQEWMQKYRGKFDQGWDVLREQIYKRQKQQGLIPANASLTPRPAAIPAWKSLSRDEQRLAARQMEAYAATLAHADYQAGRVIDELRRSGQLDNTLVVYIQGDNGGSGEGGLYGRLFEQSAMNGMIESTAYSLSRIDDIGGKHLYNAYPAGWAWATASPFQWMKTVASHFGGTRNGMVMSWPRGIESRGEIRSQFHYVTDIVPTLLDAAKLQMPAQIGGVEQQPLDGVSMQYTFGAGASKLASHRQTQVFELSENLGIYHDGWFAGTKPFRAPWEWNNGQYVALDDRNWSLYRISTDFSQAHDLAKSDPDKLAQMQALFWSEAEKSNILPIHPTALGRRNGLPGLAEGRTQFTYTAKAADIPETAAPPISGKSFSIVADVVVPAAGADGVMVAHGGRFGGYSFYLDQGHVVFHYNALDPRRYTIRTPDALSAGAHRLTAKLLMDEGTQGPGGDGGPGAQLTISVDGERAATGRIEHTRKFWISHTEGFDVGQDLITPVSDDYTVDDSSFRGEIKKIDVMIE